MPSPYTPRPEAHGNWFAAIPAAIPAELLTALRQSAPPHLRWFAPEDVHLTLAFFGGFRDERKEAVLACAASLPPFSINATLGKLRPLPSPRRFSALSFELNRGATDVAALMEAYHQPLMAAAGVSPDPRPALPHITIARPDRRASPADRHAILAWSEAASLPAVEITLSEISIYGWAEDRSVRQFRRLDG